MAGYYDMGFIEKLIRSEAAKRGIDPDQAMRVAQSEGFRPNTWQSDVYNNGVREQSYGPFQLNVNGGLGETFMKTYHEDPRDPSTVQDQIRFTLDMAKRGGWGPWHGWKGDPWAGIKTPVTGNVDDPTDVGGLARGSKMAAGQAADTTRAATIPATPATPAAPVVATQLTGASKGKSLGGLLGELASSGGQQPELLSPPPPMRGGAGGSSGALQAFLQQYIDSLTKPQQPPGGTGLG